MLINTVKLVLLVAGFVTLHGSQLFAQTPVEELPVPEPTAIVTAVDNEHFPGASISWKGNLPKAGSLVKIQLRGEVLQYLLSANSSWQLASSDQPVPCILLPAEIPKPFYRVELGFEVAERADGKSINVAIDRGAEPAPLNRIAIRFAATSYLGEVKIFSSTNQTDYRKAGGSVLLYQEISAGHILSVGELVLDVGETRYLRLSMPIPTGGIQAVQGWLDPQSKLEVYKTQATLGPMIEGSQAGESGWPIFMKPDDLPIAKIKVLADAPGQVRQVHLAIMNDARLGQQVGQGISWAGLIEQDSLRLENKWITNTEESQLGPWAVVVNDGDAMPLQLSGVEVYVQEHWLVFEMPEGGEPQLWQVEGETVAEIPLDDLRERIDEASVYGSLLSWDLLQTSEIDMPKTESWFRQPLSLAKQGGRQLRMIAYIALAGVLVITGFALIRREKRI